jgi:hypothetical protein
MATQFIVTLCGITFASKIIGELHAYGTRSASIVVGQLNKLNPTPFFGVNLYAYGAPLPRIE